MRDKKHNYMSKHDDAYHYKHLSIRALEGLHEHVAQYVSDNYDTNSKILILGAGTGAFEARLFDMGFKQLTSTDIHEESYLYENDKISFIKTDLNTQFSSIFNENFDLIIAIEIIEHLHSTAHFLSEAKKILTNNGTLYITTPNVHSHESKVACLVTGYPSFFYGKPMQYQHVNPILYGTLLRLCEDLGLTIVHTNSILNRKLTVRRKILFIILKPLSKSLYALHNKFVRAHATDRIPKQLSDGAISVYIMKQNNREQNS